MPQDKHETALVKSREVPAHAIDDGGLMQRFGGSVVNVVSRDMNMLRTAVVFV